MCSPIIGYVSGCAFHRRTEMNAIPRELWDLYDKEGTPLGRTVYRGDILNEGEYHLVVQVWVRRRDGRYLIQKRSEDLELLPGVWATTAGSVLAGENCVSSAARELNEELGIDVDPLELDQVFRRVRDDSIGSAWFVERDVEPSHIRLQEEEVSEVKWTTPEEIRGMVADGTFYDYGSAYFEALFGYRKHPPENQERHATARG